MVSKNKLPNAELRTVHTTQCGVPGVNAMSHVALESFQDLEHVTMALLVSTVLVMNMNKLNAMLLIRVSPCGLTGLNALLPVAADTNLDNDHTFAPMKLTNRQLHVIKTQAHGQLGLSGLLAVHHVVAEKLIEAEFIAVLASEKNRQ